MNGSLIPSLVSPKAYTHELAFDKLHELEMIAKSKEKVFLRDVVTPDTSKPSAEDGPKNIRVQEVQKWITNAAQQTVFEHLNYGEIEEAVRKIIADRVAGWNWKIDQGDECPFVMKKNLVVGAAESVRGMECIVALHELMEKQIVDAINFKELEATAIGCYMMRKCPWLLEWWNDECMRTAGMMKWWLNENLCGSLPAWMVNRYNRCVGFPTPGGIVEPGDPLKLGHYDNVWDIVRSLRL
jgi:hypothetical protein